MKKFLHVAGWIVGILLVLIVILAALVLRPLGEADTGVFTVSAEETRNVMGAAVKLSRAVFRGMREPEKSFTVTLKPGETRALLTSLRRIGDPYLEDRATLRTLTTESGKIVCVVEIPLKIVMVPVTVKVRGKISGGAISVKFDSIRAGALPVPTFVAQRIVDRELAKFQATPEGKILPDFVSSTELAADGALTITATAQGFKFLHERLLKIR